MDRKYIVFDLEATCWEDFQKRNMNEIVEIGAFKVNAFGETKSRFHSFVRPAFHPHLSPFFMRLTGIDASDVFNAPGFKVVFNRFMNWVLQEGEEYLLCAWGNKDLLFMQENTRAHRLPCLDEERYLDVKAAYHEYIRPLRGKPAGLMKALHLEGIEFEGRQHRALDDAFNLSRLFVKYIDVWQRFGKH